MKKLIQHTIKAGLAGAVLALCLAGTTQARDLPEGHESSCAFGEDLAAWQDLYWRWTYGAIKIPADHNGNATVGNVVLMALPDAPGDGTPGSIAVTLKSGQAFMLPLWNLLGTSYTDGTPPDPLVDVSVFKTMQLTLKIDGVTVLDHRNLMDHFSQFRFKPPVPLNSPPVDSIIWLEGISILHKPLTPGKHVIKLDAKNTEPIANFGGLIIEYHNTWNVTVKPGK